MELFQLIILGLVVVSTVTGHCRISRLRLYVMQERRELYRLFSLVMDADRQREESRTVNRGALWERVNNYGLRETDKREPPAS